MQLRHLIIALCLLVASATAAFAHAGLISTDPSDGAVVPAEPAGMTLVYTEPVSPIGFSIVGLSGTPVPLTADKQDGPTVHVPFPPNLAKGSYLFSWRVTSEDGHPVNGTVGFAIGVPSGTIAAAAADPMLAASIWAVRALQYVALFFGVGSVAFGALQPPPAWVRRLSRGLAAAGLMLVAPALVLQGFDLLGLPPAAALTSAPWTEAVASTYAQTQALFALAFVLALVPGRWMAVAAALVGALAPALSGHASTAQPPVLMRAVVFAHIASLLFWLGALLPLFGLLRAGGAAALAQFSRIVPWAIGALLASGLTLALVQLGPPRADWVSPYGVLLAAKLGLVAVLLALALWNRVRLTVHATSGDSNPLRRSIVVELALVAIILGIVAGWRFTPPPRVLAGIDTATAPVSVPLTASTATGTLLVTPGRPGPMSLDVALPAAAESVTIQLQNAAEGIATISKAAAQRTDGHWQVTGLILPVGGNWSVAVAARTGKFDLTTFTGTLSLAGTETPMTTPKLAAALVSSMLLTAPASAAGPAPSCTTGQNFTHGAITVTGAFTRATPKAAQSAGAYFTIFNAGPDADTLTGATSTAASDITLHVMKMDGNVMKMDAVDGGLAVPPGGTATLDPMGYHLMMTGLSQPFVQGQCVLMTLHFAKAGDIPIELNVGSFAQSGPPIGDPAAASKPMNMDSMSSMAM